jgi:galactitol-specific phosphotransferase system IIB component
MTIMKSYGDEPGVTMKQLEPDDQGVKIVEIVESVEKVEQKEDLPLQVQKTATEKSPKEEKKTTIPVPSKKIETQTETLNKVGRPKGSKGSKNKK